MNTIIKKQHQIAKQILSQVIILDAEYKKNPNDINFNHFNGMFNHFLLVIGEVYVGYYNVIGTGMRINGMSYADWCKMKFDEYEKEIKKAGLLNISFDEMLDQDVKPIIAGYGKKYDPIEYTDEQKDQMWYEYFKNFL